MDPDLQEAFSDVQSSVYRTALKLRSVQSLCQLDLIDVSLIQHILSSEQSQREEQISLNMQQISRMLMKLFQRARIKNPGQVDPRAVEFTLSLLIAMYDRSGTGYVKTRSAAAALISLSGDTLLAKYRGGKCMILYTVLNAAIVEEKFLSWLRSEPAVLLWLPTCYRISATEMVSHQARCRVCKVFPITGIRYRCLKCLNFDLCPACFFTGRLCKPHKRSHPVVEHCVQMSAKVNAKHFLHTIRNNLFQERCRRKEAQRRTALESVEERHFPAHKKTLYMKKQFKKWKDEMQFLHSCQEEKSCKIEAKLQKLRVSQENLQIIDKPFMGQHNKAKEKLPKLTENSLGGVGNTVFIPTAMQIPPDEKEVREELELLMMKLKDTLSFQTKPGINSPIILTLSSCLHPVYSIILFIIR
uniref:ZZ-type domain-containing protein n=1 Tax=Cyanoderma ruficeps TaxID=181631 RepID=A0A8C3P1F5_9PASS